MARRVFTQRSTRQFIWSSIVLRSAGIALGTAKSTGGVSALGVTTSGATLIRTRGMMQIHFDPTSIGDTFQWAVGLGIYSSDAFAAGAASLPGPLSDVDYDWVWHKIGAFGPSFSATEDGTNIRNNLWIEIDSKAMRKLKPSQTMGFMVEGIILSGGGTIDFGMSARQLFKLG